MKKLRKLRVKIIKSIMFLKEKKALGWRVKLRVQYESRPVMVPRMDLVANEKKKKNPNLRYISNRPRSRDSHKKVRELGRVSK